MALKRIGFSLVGALAGFGAAGLVLGLLGGLIAPDASGPTIQTLWFVVEVPAAIIGFLAGWKEWPEWQ